MYPANKGTLSKLNGNKETSGNMDQVKILPINLKNNPKTSREHGDFFKGTAERVAPLNDPQELQAHAAGLAEENRAALLAL